MILRRIGWLAAIAAAAVLEISCGQVYRPVVIPTGIIRPNPQDFHAVFAINTNVAFDPGTALQIDVSGDSDIGAENVGINPTHLAILPNNSRVFVASAGSLFPGDADTVIAFTPASDSSTATGLGSPTIFSLPNFGPTAASGQPTWSCSYLPDFVTTTQQGFVYLANYGVDNDPNCNSNLPSTDSVGILNTTSNSISKITYLGAGTHPVAMSETPDALNLYVLNQGTNNILDLSPTDLSTLASLALPAGSSPTWVVARQDSRQVYVLTQGGGQLIPIDTATNTILTSQTNLNVGVGANFVLYDKALNRLYVTNPTNGTVYVFSATGGVDSTGAANDTPSLLATISMSGGANPPCPNGCSPVSVTALPDGSRFYVASYELESACQDPNVVTSGGSPAPCMIPMLTVFDAASITVKPVPSTLLAAPSLSLLTSPPFTGTQYAVAQAPSCVTAPAYSPASVRFRMYTTSSIDSTHVYVSICDAGVIADIDTVSSSISTGGSNNPDTVITDIAPPFSSGPIQVNGEPLPQSPVFLLTGQ